MLFEYPTQKIYICMFEHEINASVIFITTGTWWTGMRQCYSHYSISIYNQMLWMHVRMLN